MIWCGKLQRRVVVLKIGVPLGDAQVSKITTIGIVFIRLYLLPEKTTIFILNREFLPYYSLMFFI